MGKNRRTVLFVSPESAPYKATGGLADVAEALPSALNDEGIEAIRVMPKYLGIEKKYNLVKLFSFIVEVGRRATVADIYVLNDEGVLTYFIGNKDYFEREKCYSYHDDDIRFGFFCKASLEMLMFLNIKPDVIHLNDWQTALTGLILKEEYSEIDFYKSIKVVFTIHNLQYQGVFDINALGNLNLSTKYFNTDKVEYYGKVCYMKAGIVYADLVTTVSETYAKEIQTQIYGYGLDGLLRRYTYKIKGILNGIYYSKYDPETDEALFANFNSENFQDYRKENKFGLQKELGLPVKDVPVFGIVTRFAEQKGIELIFEALLAYLDEDVQFVVLGAGEPEYENRMISFQHRYPDKISVIVQFNQAMAKKIYGTSDFFLMPSLFEPCGLSQLYSLRYGSIPIVRETGGLMDTIIDYDQNPTEGTGFTFKNFDFNEFYDAIQRALVLYDNKEEFNALIKRGMEQRFSWHKAAREYIDEYNELITR